MQPILHIDTSTDKCIIAISNDGKILAQNTSYENRNHAGTVNHMINEILAGISITMNEISAIAVCAGPGSYTGLRIGVATAKGICYAIDKPLMLHNRLTLLAYHPWLQKTHAAEFISLLYARVNEYFISIYNSDFECLYAPAHIGLSELSELIDKKDNSYIITDVSVEEINSINQKNLHIDTNTQINLHTWAHYAFLSYRGNNTINISEAEPFYLKQVYTHK